MLNVSVRLPFLPVSMTFFVTSCKACDSSSCVFPRACSRRNEPNSRGAFSASCFVT